MFVEMILQFSFHFIIICEHKHFNCFILLISLFCWVVQWKISRTTLSFSCSYFCYAQWDGIVICYFSWYIAKMWFICSVIWYLVSLVSRASFFFNKQVVLLQLVLVLIITLTTCLDGFKKAVDSSSPRDQIGMYWGYKVRYCSNLSSVIRNCPYKVTKKKNSLALHILKLI